MNIKKPSCAMILLVVLGAVLAACNFPTSQAARTNKPTESDLAQADTLATVVALTLTSAPIGSVPANTQTGGTEATPLPPTASPTVTATSTPAVTLTPTQTLTPVQDDPAVLLGNPTGKDDLDKGNGFGLTSPYADDHTRMEVTNGALVVSNNATNGWRGWRVRPPKLKNFYLEGTFIVDSCGSKDTYGLVFRANDYTSGMGYYYGVSCDGHYSLTRWDNSGTSVLITPTTSDKILTGAGQTNRLGVWAQDGHFKFYANGKLVAEFDDSSLAEGYYGPWISGYSGGLVFRLDRIAYWVQP